MTPSRKTALSLNGLSEREALRERVKELTCLYGIAQVVASTNGPIGTVLKSAVKILPPAWQYPEVASARIMLDGNSYTTRGWRLAIARQSADIRVRGEDRG